ncbi:hypothetical protein DNTS_007167 [Danionella cerebrum]|uniref:BCL2/adenovirus E1B 19 kDa protein-interacting protein 3-like n=1 Tax=Danionella cerebrum TaxID=2873325 RepID=A0A553REW4_9TELE|nr:hypothetical protein DNTS_007167 [Danionella translucida]
MSTQRIVLKEENLHDSWVELHFDSRSEHSEEPPGLCDFSDLEKMLLEAQRESSSSSSQTSSHCSSPRRVQTPPLISAAALSAQCIAQGEVTVESKQEAEAMSRICDWSSRPENVAPVAFLIKRQKRSRVFSKNTDRKEQAINPDLLKFLLPSLVLTHIIVLGLGICIGRRISAQCSAI